MRFLSITLLFLCNAAFSESYSCWTYYEELGITSEELEKTLCQKQLLGFRVQDKFQQEGVECCNNGFLIVPEDEQTCAAFKESLQDMKKGGWFEECSWPSIVSGNGILKTTLIELDHSNFPNKDSLKEKHSQLTLANDLEWDTTRFYQKEKKVTDQKQDSRKRPRKKAFKNKRVKQALVKRVPLNSEDGYYESCPCKEFVLTEKLEEEFDHQWYIFITAFNLGILEIIRRDKLDIHEGCGLKNKELHSYKDNYSDEELYSDQKSCYGKELEFDEDSCSEEEREKKQKEQKPMSVSMQVKEELKIALATEAMNWKLDHPKQLRKMGKKD
jgi:predicted nucleic acid-binding Zn ribbon protein